MNFDFLSQWILTLVHFVRLTMSAEFEFKPINEQKFKNRVTAGLPKMFSRFQNCFLDSEKMFPGFLKVFLSFPKFIPIHAAVLIM